MSHRLIATILLLACFAFMASAQQSTCPADKHCAILTWVGPTTGDTPSGYNVYRTSTSGTGYVKVGSVEGATASTWTDLDVLADQVWYYVVTSFANRANGTTVESAYSNESEPAIIPFRLGVPAKPSIQTR